MCGGVVVDSLKRDVRNLVRWSLARRRIAATSPCVGENNDGNNVILSSIVF